ncbi:MAG: DUF2807 domain-containing protein [Bacteroidia bacterium]|nr:DUF2807 domain-containing protein [Bacteroidia bacterium]
MKTSIKLLWILFGLMAIALISVAISVRLDLTEIVPEDGNGRIEEKLIPFEAFKGFDASNGLHVTFRQADRYEVKIVADSNLLDKVFVNVHDGWLSISKAGDIGKITKMEVYISAPHLVGFNAQNNAVVRVDSLLEQEKIDIRVSNVAEVHLFCVTKTLKLSARNSGKIFVAGETEDLEANASSSSEISGFDLLSQFAEVSGEGASEVKVRVEQRLISNGNGGSRIWYLGPEHLLLKSSGNVLPTPWVESDDNLGEE